MIKNEVLEILPEVIEWRRYLHKNPEIGFDLDNTVKYVCEQLDKMGIPYNVNVGSKSSIIAEIDGANEGKTVAVRADMDALPIEENTGLEFESKNGCMHACGHDAHTAMLLGVAKLLNSKKDKIKGKVKLIFQPAEELGTGSKGICEAGVLKDVDEIVGLHCGNIAGAGVAGEMYFSRGSMMATMDKFSIKVIGKGAHGAYPSLSKDPIVIGAEIVSGIQNIISREIEGTEPAIITIGKFHSGTAFNIIPGEAIIEGTSRTVTKETRDFVYRRIGEVAKGIAKAFRADAEYEFFFQPPPVVNDYDVASRLIESAKKLYPDSVKEMTKPSMGGEDFAWYMEEVPGAFFLLQNPMEIDGKIWAHHNPKFALDEKQFEKGIAVVVQFVMDELS